MVYAGREDLNESDNYLAEVAVDTPLRTLKGAVAPQTNCMSACCLQGVVYAGREDLSEPDNYLAEVAVDTPLRTLKEAVAGADVFLGLSVSVSLCHLSS
jgi:malic enzyme